MRCSLTYEEIKDYIREHYGYTVQPCAIARVLRDLVMKLEILGIQGRQKNQNCLQKKTVSL